MFGLRKNVSLKDLTTFKVGGKADYFIEISQKRKLIQVLRWAKKKNLPFFILGNGSNVLFSDKGFKGLVIKIKNKKIRKTKKTLIAGAGILLPELSNIFLKNGWAGLEWANGIPGTLGGAIYGNAGAFGEEIKNIIKNVKTIDINSLKEKKYNREGCQFAYRESGFKEKKEIIWEAELITKKGNKKELKKKAEEFIKYKIGKGFFKYPSAGSVFKNIKIDETPFSKFFKKNFVFINGKKVEVKAGKVSAGFFIEQCGLKGKKIGGAMISDFHANIIVNFDKAKAEEILFLIDLCKEKVYKKFKIQLKEEIIVINT